MATGASDIKPSRSSVWVQKGRPKGFFRRPPPSWRSFLGVLEVQNHPQEPQEQVQDILELIPDRFSSQSDHRSPSYGHLKVYGRSNPDFTVPLAPGEKQCSNTAGE